MFRIFAVVQFTWLSFATHGADAAHRQAAVSFSLMKRVEVYAIERAPLSDNAIFYKHFNNPLDHRITAWRPPYGPYFTCHEGLTHLKMWGMAIRGQLPANAEYQARERYAKSLERCERAVKTDGKSENPTIPISTH